MLRLRSRAVGVAVALLVTACAPVGAGGGAGPRPQSNPFGEIELIGDFTSTDEQMMFHPTVMNARGEVLNYPYRTTWSYLWRDGERIDFSDDVHVAVDLSDKGHVVGSIRVDSVEQLPVPFLWKDGELSTLPIGDAVYGRASSVNDRGDVLGTLYDDRSPPQAAAWRNGQLATLPDPGSKGHTSEPIGINDRGQILVQTVDGDNRRSAVLWNLRRGDVVELGTLGGQNSDPVAINNRGMVIGTSDTADGNRHGFLWHRGKMELLSGPDGSDVHGFRPRAINNWGQIAGVTGENTGINPGRGEHVVLWQNGRVANLSDEVVEEYGVKQWELIGLNDRGQLLAGNVQFGASPIGTMWRVPHFWGHRDRRS